MQGGGRRGGGGQCVGSRGEEGNGRGRRNAGFSRRHQADRLHSFHASTLLISPPHLSTLPQKRVGELARWLSSRPEKFIILIGHCAFWHEFRGKTEKRMGNGEMRCMRW